MTADAPGATIARKPLSPHLDLDHLRRQAKQRLALLRRANPAAQLADAQRSVAREYGAPNWRALKHRVEGTPTRDDLPKPWSLDLSAATAEARRRGDVDAEERVILDLLACYPDDEELQAFHANLLFERRGDAAGAAAIFERLLARPTADTLRHYARFRQRSAAAGADETEALLQRAVALAGEPFQRAAALNNYGWFLLEHRKDAAAADQALRQAAELECGWPMVEAANLGCYAAFLWRLGDARRAEEYFRRARARSRKDAATALTFAGLLTATGRAREGVAMAREVLESWLPTVVFNRVAVELECWFLIYAHGRGPERREALRELKARLLDPGVERHAGNDLRRSAAAATTHPDPALVEALAVLLSHTEPPVEGEVAVLDRFRAWTDSPP